MQLQAQHEIKRRERDYEKLQVLSPVSQRMYLPARYISVECFVTIIRVRRSSKGCAFAASILKPVNRQIVASQLANCLLPERPRHAVQGRLRDLLVEKSREQKVALEAVGRFRDTARVRAKKSDEAMYQVCAG